MEFKQVAINDETKINYSSTPSQNVSGSNSLHLLLYLTCFLLTIGNFYGKAIEYNNTPPPLKFLCFKRRQKNWRHMPDRSVHPGIPDTKIPTNKIRTSKYTLLTFIPKNLLEQFTKLANVYFLVIIAVVWQTNISGR